MIDHIAHRDNYVRVRRADVSPAGRRDPLCMVPFINYYNKTHACTRAHASIASEPLDMTTGAPRSVRVIKCS